MNAAAPPRGAPPPLRLLAAVGAGVGGLSVLAATAGVLLLTGPSPAALGGVLGAGLGVVCVVALLAALLAPRAVRSTAETTALSRALEAMGRRVRLAEQSAEQARRNAETASAGMAELLAGLVAAEEGARGQLAAELHDTVAQSLSRARSLLSERAVGPAAELLAEAEEQVRGVMARTRPPGLRGGDLAVAMAQMRDDLARRYALSVTVDWPAQPRPLPLATAVTVYRFFQEGLLNVAKHCDTGRATATLGFTTGALVAEVCDEGPGFDPAAVRGRDGRQVGLGLLGERARLAGGTLSVDARPGQGVRLRLQLPVPAPAPDEAAGRAAAVEAHR